MNELKEWYKLLRFGWQSAVAPLLSPRSDRSEERAKKFHTDDASKTCFWLVEAAVRPIRRTTLIWIVTRHQCDIFALVPETSFPFCFFSALHFPFFARYASLLHNLFQCRHATLLPMRNVAWRHQKQQCSRLAALPFARVLFHQVPFPLGRANAPGFWVLIFSIDSYAGGLNEGEIRVGLSPSKQSAGPSTHFVTLQE